MLWYSKFPTVDNKTFLLNFTLSPLSGSTTVILFFIRYSIFITPTVSRLFLEDLTTTPFTLEAIGRVCLVVSIQSVDELFAIEYGRSHTHTRSLVSVTFRRSLRRLACNRLRQTSFPVRSLSSSGIHFYGAASHNPISVLLSTMPIGFYASTVLLTVRA